MGVDFARSTAPVPLHNPRLVDLSTDAAKNIGWRLDTPEQKLVALLNGEWLPEGAQPVASIYAGHQFGSWVSQLGDGRALLLGQIETTDGDLWELQLKGSGPTDFSRQGDGRAVLRSTIREYLCSEAMHGLGVPTTRALAMIDSDTPVYREEVETGAVVMRLAPSFVRFGHFELFASRGQVEQVRQLADHLLKHYRPHLLDSPKPYLALYRDVIGRTAKLMAMWQSVGFSHGVMNSDNMSILGLTLDYGPFGFMETYQPGYICNHSDHSGRYAYSKQPNIALWNLACLGNGMLPILDLADAKQALEGYRDIYTREFYERFRAKLGLVDEQIGDHLLVDDWLQLMHHQGLDFSNGFRNLSAVTQSGNGLESLAGLAEADSRTEDWLIRYRARLQQQDLADSVREEAMNRVNPLYLLRNHLAQTAIELAQHGDYSEVRRLRELLADPFNYRPGHGRYTQPAPAGSAEFAVSCSS